MGLVKKLLNAFISFTVKRKILSLTIFGMLGLLIVIYTSYQVKHPKKPKPQQVYNNLYITIPDGAYPAPKEYDIKKLSAGEIKDLEARIPGLKVISGEAYNVTPKDGRYEFAYKPIEIKIYIPSEYFYGEDLTGVAIAYIPHDNPNVFYILPGSTMGRDANGYYVEARTFHTSIIAAVQVKSERQLHSLRLIREVASSVKASVIIVPGEDPNFSGGLNGETNFWTSVFPDRSIYVYSYPLADDRSMRYEKDAEEFFKKSGKRSYVLFEAENLARILKDPALSRNSFVVIAHGVGGLIARLALERHPDIRNVKKLVLLSTPGKGTNLANPMFFSSFLYGKSNSIISQNLGVNEKMIPVIKTHIYTYLENINVFYKDLVPGAEVQKMLSPRNDISYLVIAGTVPPMRIDLKGTELGKFYPELVKGEGDGIVSVDSARIPGKPFVKFDISFFGYSRADVLNTIKSFVNTEKIPTPPPFKTDTYKEFLSRVKLTPPSTKTTAATPTQVEKEKKLKEVVGFSQPNGFMLKDILRIVAKRKISSYISGSCLGDKPYFSTGEGLETWDYVVESGTFRFLKNIGGELTMICGEGGKCRVNPIGFGRMEGSVKLGEVDDVLVGDNGRVYAAVPGEGGTEKLVIHTDTGYRVIYEAPGTFGKIIPTKDGMEFLTDYAVAFLSRDGKLRKVFTMDAIAVKGHKAVATYALEKNGILYVLTTDHYLLVYDEKMKKSWIVGEGNIAEGFKIVDLDGRHLILLGKKVVFFVDTLLRRLKGCYQVFDFEIVDGFACNGNLYLVTEKNGAYEIRIYKPVGLDLPCESG